MITSDLNNPSFAKQILDWYDNSKEEYPWRQTADPYQIWVSEVMLQQTQVATVIPYYFRWLEVFPNIESVAQAKSDQVLKLWEGLGYYSRARNFYKACQIILQEYGGKIPDQPGQFASLPGVGPYISAAVMSIAHNFALPAIDGNAGRIFSRIYSLEKPYQKNKDQISSLALDVMDQLRPGDFNQAIMDFGRKVCTVQSPACVSCPLSLHCSAFINSSVDNYPVKIPTRKKPHYNVAVGIIWRNNQILISKRKESGLLGGMWEFPGGKIERGESAEHCVVREVQEELGILVETTEFLQQIKHAYTHFSITMDAFHCKFISGSPKPLGCTDWRWIYPEEVHDLPFPKACHKLFDKLFSAEQVC